MRFTVYNGPQGVPFTFEDGVDFRQDSSLVEADGWAEALAKIESSWHVEEGQLLFIVREIETGKGPQFREGRLYRVAPQSSFRLEPVR